MTNALCGARPCRCAPWGIVDLAMTVGMKKDQIFTLIMLVDTIPVMQGEGCLALDALSTEGTAACLLPPECCTKRRGPVPRQVTLAVLAGSLPERIAWMRVALALTMTLGCDRCLYTEAVCAGRRLSQAPGVARLLGTRALGDPASRCVWMAERGPAIASSPDATVELRPRLPPDAVTMRVGPPSAERMQRLAAWGRGGPCGVAPERCDLGREGLHPGRAGGHLALGRLAVGADLCADRLPSAVNALGAWGHARLGGGEPPPAGGDKGVNRRQDGVVEHVPGVGRAQKVSSPAHVGALGHPAMPVPPVPDVCEAVEPSIPDDGRHDAALGHACRGRNEGAAIPQATSKPCGQESLGHGEGLCKPRQGEVIEKPVPSPCHEPGGRRRLAEEGEALRSRLGASALRTAPLGMGSRRGCGDRLEGVERDGVPRPLRQRRHRAGALGALFLGHVEAVQRSGAVAAPGTKAVAGRGLLLGRLPECVVAPRRLWAGVRGHSSDGARARQTSAPTESAGTCPCAKPRPARPGRSAVAGTGPDDATLPRCPGASTVSAGPRTRGVPWTPLEKLRPG